MPGTTKPEGTFSLAECAGAYIVMHRLAGKSYSGILCRMLEFTGQRKQHARRAGKLPHWYLSSRYFSEAANGRLFQVKGARPLTIVGCEED